MVSSMGGGWFDRPRKPARFPLEAILRDDALVGGALWKAARQAIQEHKDEGLPLAMWRDGEVVWVPAEEIEAQVDPHQG